MDPIKLKPEILILYFLILFISVGLIAHFYIPYLEPKQGDRVAGGATTEKKTFSRVYALDKQTGVERWVFEDKDIMTEPVPDGDVVYVGNKNGALQALESKTGVINWDYQTFGSILYPPIVKNSIIFLTSTGKRPDNPSLTHSTLYEIDPKTQSNIWKNTIPTSGQSDELVTLNAPVNFSPILAGKYLLYPDESGYITVYDVSQSSTPVYVNTYQYRPRSNNDNNIDLANNNNVLLVASTESLRVIPVSDYIGPERLSKQIFLKILSPVFSKNVNYSFSDNFLVYPDLDFTTKQVAIYRYDMASGSEVKITTLPKDQMVSYIKLDKNILVYQVSFPNKDRFEIHAYDIVTNRELWVNSNQSSCCQYVFSVHDGVLYYNLSGVYIRAVQLQTGREIWVNTYTGAVTSELIFDDSRIVFSTGNGVRVIDRGTGQDLWSYQIKERYMNPAIKVDKDNVYFTSSEF